jgi:hypothetical protein
MLVDEAPAATQLSTLLEPFWILVGVAIKDAIAGFTGRAGGVEVLVGGVVVAVGGVVVPLPTNTLSMVSVPTD